MFPNLQRKKLSKFPFPNWHKQSIIINTVLDDRGFVSDDVLAIFYVANVNGFWIFCHRCLCVNTNTWLNRREMVGISWENCNCCRLLQLIFTANQKTFYIGREQNEQWIGTYLLRSLEIGFKCMKLQKPERVHSPISYWRQHASRKSVTGDNSEYTGRPPNQRLFNSFPARSASSSRRNCLRTHTHTQKEEKLEKKIWG